jgi:predicted chitinase
MTEKKSIFDLADKFGMDESPLGGWLKTNSIDVHIVEMIVSNSIIPFALSCMSETRNTNRPVVPVTVKVVTSSFADRVEVTYDDGNKRTALRKNGNTEWEAHYDIPFTTIHRNKAVTFTATVIDIAENKVIDTKSIKTVINVDGDITYPIIDELKETEGEGECLCKAKLKVENIIDIVKNLRENTYYEWKDKKTGKKGKSPLTNLPYYAVDKIFHRNNITGKFKEEIVTNNSFENFVAQLNMVFENYEINNCKRRAHFLAQVFVETQNFSQTVETDNDYTNNYDPYRGRGFMHLTHDYNYEKYQAHSKNMVVDNYSLVSTNLEIAADSAGWFWKFGSRFGDINKIADNKTVKDVTKAVNGGSMALQARETAYEILIKFFDGKGC